MPLIIGNMKILLVHLVELTIGKKLIHIEYIEHNCSEQKFLILSVKMMYILFLFEL